MKTTKEQLQKELAEVTEKLNEKLRSDMSVRSTLSELLGSYEWNQNSWPIHTEKKVVIKDWLGIAFLIGELKSDADFSCMLESKEMFRRENEELRKKINELTSPKELN